MKAHAWLDDSEIRGTKAVVGKGKRLIVMNNASYHSRLTCKIPSSSWRKADIQEWLGQNGVVFDVSLRKPELLDLVRPLKKRKCSSWTA